MSSRAMADYVFSTPELQQCVKEDLLWQLRLAQDIRQDEVGLLTDCNRLPAVVDECCQHLHPKAASQ